MPGPLFHVGAVATCPHGAPITTVSAIPRVLVTGMPVVTTTDSSMVAGCPFVTPAGTPQPCVKVMWTTPAARAQVMGQPLTALSVGICIAANGVPNGPAIIASTQPRAIAT